MFWKKRKDDSLSEKGNERRRLLRGAAGVTAGLGLGLFSTSVASGERSPVYEVESVYELGGRKLQDKIEEYINKDQTYREVQNIERTGVVVFGLESESFLVQVNEYADLQAASMIKPFIVLAFLCLSHRGKDKYKLDFGEVSQDHINKCIRDSDNKSTNWLMEECGKALDMGGLTSPLAVSLILKEYFPDIAKLVDIVEFIPDNGRTYKNKAQPRAYSKLLYSLVKNQDPEFQILRSAMELDSKYDRLYQPNDGGKVLFNKTGSTSRANGDFGVVETKSGKRYIIAIMIDRTERYPDALGGYSKWQDDVGGKVVQNISKLVYEYIES